MMKHSKIKDDTYGEDWYFDLFEICESEASVFASYGAIKLNTKEYVGEWIELLQSLSRDLAGTGWYF